MSPPVRIRETNITLKIQEDVLLWARMRAGFAGTSVNRLVRAFLCEYAAVPETFRAGEWTTGARAVDTFRQAMDPAGAGDRAREAGEASFGRGLSRPSGS